MASGNSTRLNRLNSRVRRLLDPTIFRWLPKTEEKWEKALARIDPAAYETKISKLAKLRQAVVLSRKERTMVLDLVMEMGEMQMRVPEHEIWAQDISNATKIIQRCFRRHMARKGAAQASAELKQIAAIQEKSFWHDSDEDQSQPGQSQLDQSLVLTQMSAIAHDADSWEKHSREEDFFDAQASSGDNDETRGGQDTTMSSLATIHSLLDDFLDITRPHMTTRRRNSHNNKNHSSISHGTGSKFPTDDNPMVQKQKKRYSQQIRRSLMVMGTPVSSEAIIDSLHVPRSSTVIAGPDASSNGDLENDTEIPPLDHAHTRRQTLISIDHSRETRVRASIVQAYKTAGLLPVMVNNQEEANDVKAGMYRLGEPPEHEEDAPILQILRRGTLRLKPIVYDSKDSDSDDDDCNNSDEIYCQPQDESSNDLNLFEQKKGTLASAATGPIIVSSMKGTKDAFTSAMQTMQSSVRRISSIISERRSNISIISERRSTRQSLFFPSFSHRPSESQQGNSLHDNPELPRTSTVKKLVDGLDLLPAAVAHISHRTSGITQQVPDLRRASTQLSQEHHTGDNSIEVLPSSELLGGADRLLVDRLLAVPPTSGEGQDSHQHQQTPTSKLRADQTKPPGLSAGHAELRNYLARRGAPKKKPVTLPPSTKRAGMFQPPDLSNKRAAAMVTMDWSTLQMSPSLRPPSHTIPRGNGNRGVLLPTKPMSHATNKGSSLAKHTAVRPNKTFGGQTSSPATPLFQQAGYVRKSFPLASSAAAEARKTVSPQQQGSSGEAQVRPHPPAAHRSGAPNQARRVEIDKKDDSLRAPVRPSSTFPAIGPSDKSRMLHSKLRPEVNGLVPAARSKAW